MSHIHCRINLSPKPLKCVTLCHHFYLLSSLFKCVTDEVGVVCPNPTFSHYPDGFYCTTFHTACFLGTQMTHYSRTNCILFWFFVPWDRCADRFLSLPSHPEAISDSFPSGSQRLMPPLPCPAHGSPVFRADGTRLCAFPVLWLMIDGNRVRKNQMQILTVPLVNSRTSDKKFKNIGSLFLRV